MLYEATTTEPGFRELFRGSEHRQPLCVLTIVAWVACCDGKVSPREQELLRNVAEGYEGTDREMAAAMEAAKSGSPQDLEVACRYLRSHASRSAKKLLAQLAITMAVLDGRLTVSENYVLQFLADLLDISPRGFNRLFEKTTGRPFPQAGDPSSTEWWKAREQGRQATPPADQWRIGSPSKGPSDAKPPEMDRAEALEVLGLDEGATAEMIRANYRRLARKRHPDRFAKLGRAAIVTATAAFERLRQAHDLLISTPSTAQAPASPPPPVARWRWRGSAARQEAGQKVGA